MVYFYIVVMRFFFHITEVVEQYIDPNTGIPITVEQLQAMYQHQQQPEVMYTEDGQPIQQVWPQQQVRVHPVQITISSEVFQGQYSDSFIATVLVLCDK